MRPISGRDLHRVFCKEMGKKVLNSNWNKIDPLTKRAWSKAAVAANKNAEQRINHIEAKNLALLENLKTSLDSLEKKLNSRLNLNDS